MEASGRQMRS